MLHPPCRQLRDPEALRAGPAWDAALGGIEVRFGDGRIAELGDLARGLGGRRVLVVTDPGVNRAGHAAAAVSSLEEAGLAATIYDRAGENPTDREIEAGAAFARGLDPDLLVAVGGGSAMDCAKGINFVLTNGGPMERFRGYGKTERPLLPAVAVPATAGTGSDAQSYAVISQASTGRKMACGDPSARFRAVILDPSVPATAPAEVAGAAALDAVAHAVESFVSTRANPISRLLAREAWRRLDESLERSLPEDRPFGALGEMLLAAHLAGAAIEQSMLGAAHACANPLTRRYGVAHGAAVALMLPHVVRFNASRAEPLYAELLAAGRRRLERQDSGTVELARRLEELRAAAALPARLRDAGVEQSALPELAAAAAEEWTAGFNPRPVEAGDLQTIYEAAW